MEHVVSQLIKKRSEFEGQFIFYQKKLSELEKLINASDLLIKAFNPFFNIEEIQPKRFTGNKHYFKRGESHIMILDTLRKAQEPLRTSEITKELMRKKNLDIEDQTLIDNIQKTILCTLKRQEKSNLIQSVSKDNLNGFSWILCDP